MKRKITNEGGRRRENEKDKKEVNKKTKTRNLYRGSI